MTSYLLITLLFGLVGFVGFTASKEIVNSFEGGEKEFRTIAASASQISNFTSRAEGHLMLYLVIHDEIDKKKFYSMYSSLSRYIDKLDEMVTAPKAIDIYTGIKNRADELMKMAELLIEAHDAEVARAGSFDLKSHGGLIREFSDMSGTIRMLGLELAEFETDFLNRQGAITAATELSSLVKQAEAHLMLFLVLNDETDREKFLQRYAELLRRFYVLEKKAKGESEREILYNIRSAVDEFLPRAQSLIEAHEQEIKLSKRFDYEKHKILIREVSDLASTVRKNGLELSRLNIAYETEKTASAMASAESVQKKIIYAVVISITLAFMLAYFISRSVSRPIVRLGKAAVEIGKGRMDIKLDIESKDEVGRLAESMTNMVEELRNTTVSRGYLNSILENMLTSLVVLSPEANIQMVNRTACDLFGFSEDELRGRPIGGLFEDDLIVEKSFGVELIDRGYVRSLERKCITADGRSVPVLLSASVMRDERGEVEHIVMVLNDISEHKKAQEEGEVIKAQLNQAQKMEAVGQLTGGIAHDFNNMLMVIAMYADSLHMKVQDEKLKKKVLRIMNVTDKATALTQRLLAFSRKDAADFKPCDLNTLVMNSEKFLSRLIGEDILFKVDLTDEKLPVTADSGQVDQILMNLASNARDAMPVGGTLTVTTERGRIDENFIIVNGYGEVGAYACINFDDTGVGMDKETMNCIFNPFFTTKGVEKGTGLGLSVAYGIIKQHNGYITVSSRPGEGTRFRIYLPMSKHGVRVDEPRDIKPVYPGTETVLVAEDDPEVRGLSVSALKELGYNVIEAVDGEDAVQKFKDNMDTIKLLILDVVMPRKSGTEAYKDILMVSPGTKAIFFSGYTMDIVNSKGGNMDGHNFIHKPLSMPNLSKKIREMLDA